MKYFLCNKCGNSILFVPDGEGSGGMCTEPMSVITSGICGGSFTIELVPKGTEDRKEWNPRKESIQDYLLNNSEPLVDSERYSPLNKLINKRHKFLIDSGKVKLTYTMAKKKAEQLKGIDKEIFKLK